MKLLNLLIYVALFAFTSLIAQSNYKHTASVSSNNPASISYINEVTESSFIEKQKANSRNVTLLAIISLASFSFIFITQHKQVKNINGLKHLVKEEVTYKEPNSPNAIDDQIIDIILERLTRFETEKIYLEQGITLSSLSKQFNTNSSYLSKIINTYKGKSFSTYLNELRINHAIQKLREDEKFRMYKIKAIAEEVGYSGSQSFANAFYKKTGLLPSTFIKNMKS